MEVLFLKRLRTPCLSCQAAGFCQGFGSKLTLKSLHCPSNFVAQYKVSLRSLLSLSKGSGAVNENFNLRPTKAELTTEAEFDSEAPIKVATFRVEEQNGATLVPQKSGAKQKDGPLDWYSTHMEKLFTLGPGAGEKKLTKKKKLEEVEVKLEKERSDAIELAAASLESLNTWKLNRPSPAKKKMDGVEKKEAVSDRTGSEGMGGYLEGVLETQEWGLDTDAGVSERTTEGGASDAAISEAISNVDSEQSHYSVDGGEPKQAGLLMKGVKVRRRRTRTQRKVAVLEGRVEVEEERQEAESFHNSEELLSSRTGEGSSDKRGRTKLKTKELPDDGSSIASDETAAIEECFTKTTLKGKKQMAGSIEMEDLHKDSPLRQSLKRCERCQEEKDLADYTRTVTTVDGFNPFCRACHAVINAERRGKILPQEHFEGRVCIDCKRFRKAIEFALMKNLPDGLKVRCRACDSLKQAAYRDRVSQKHEPVAFQQCARCRQTKPISGFSKHRGLKSGYDTYCKLCQRQRYLAWKAQRRRLPMPLVKEKLCAHCEVTKPASEYALSRTNFDGLQTLCRDCVALGRASRQDTAEMQSLS